jgi:glyoxylase-like metal-dependent hydrolase (beta-lactamase superfamily II)
MLSPEIENLEIKPVTDNVLLVHQIKPPHYFSCCKGLIILPKEGRNSKSIVLDLNIEPELIVKINEHFGPVSDYICTHGHMDHITYVHQWEKLGARIHAPVPEYSYLLDLNNFYEGFGFDEGINFSVIKEFAKMNGYKPCSNVQPFKPGDAMNFEGVVIETIPFLGHSKAHVGLLLPLEKIIHISCLGFDLGKPGTDGFGPWYGFKECSIDRYLKDIDLAESIFLERSSILTSSHSYSVKNPDITPFTYMRDKIAKNQNIVDQAISSLKLTSESEVKLEDFLELDLFFPKKKMNSFLLEIYNFWESGIISKHIKRSNKFQ